MNGVSDLDFKEFLRLHETQLRSSGIPGHLWRRLHEKLLYEVYDASDSVMMQRIEFENEDEDGDPEYEWDIVVTCEKLLKTDSNNIFLVDHAWSFDPSIVKSLLAEMPDLNERMSRLMDLEAQDLSSTDFISSVCNEMWKLCRHYKVSSLSNAEVLSELPELQRTIWYILDEVGSRINHSDQPTDSITIDYVEHIKDPDLRPYYLLPWIFQDFSDKSFEHSYILTEEFFQSHRVQETLPESITESQLDKTKNQLAVYTNSELVKNNLTDKRFSIAASMDQADVYWLETHFKDFKKLSTETPGRFVNQYPGEQVLTVKDLLAALTCLNAKTTEAEASNQIKSGCSSLCDWYPTTFNLVYELPQFVAYYQSYQNRLEESSSEIASSNQVRDRETTTPASKPTGACANLWILKPWNMGRGLGITITDNLNRIIRTCDTNPLIASRYITDPVLFYRPDLKANVKFDIRYVVLLRSVEPLELYTYNVFWLRFANKSFSLDDFDDYGKHFTVMNYRADENLKQINCDEFVGLFDHQYPNYQWSSVQSKIFKVLVDLFKTAVAHPPPRGLAPSKQSRALYAVDLLLEWRNPTTQPEMAPVICEVNFSPDCKRACRYHPDFFNHVFSFLFLNEPAESCNMTKLM